VPSDKRARQRAAREARLAAQEKTRKRRQQVRNLIIVAVVALLIVGIAFAVSGGNKNKSATSGSTTTTTKSTSQLTAADKTAQKAANAVAVKAGCPASTATRVNTQKYAAAPAMTLNQGDLYAATFKTTAGTFIIALDARTAPITVNNFVFLADKGYYHCVIFQRVIPGFMDQAGDPTGLGTGGPGYTITDEYPAKAASAADQYPLGSVAMANTGAPNSGGSQFFVVTGAQGESLPNTYSLFGRVVSGMSVVLKINAEGSAAGVPPDVTERILSVHIEKSGV
jgi:cyclophilin family peptidyl-prolyl cis-trans isomerase